MAAYCPVTKEKIGTESVKVYLLYYRPDPPFAFAMHYTV
jgi:hypothetical protein